MLPVDKKAVAEMHAKNKVLLFHVEDLPPLIYERMHTANEYHWHPENGKIAGRPLLDCSNCAPGETPLNSEATKELGIARYLKVCLSTFHEVMLAWYRTLGIKPATPGHLFMPRGHLFMPRGQLFVLLICYT